MLTAETSLLVLVCVSHLESRVAEVSARRRWRPQPQGAVAIRRGLRWDYRLLTLDDTSCFQHVAHLVS